MSFLHSWSWYCCLSAKLFTKNGLDANILELISYMYCCRGVLSILINLLKIKEHIYNCTLKSQIFMNSQKMKSTCITIACKQIAFYWLNIILVSMPVQVYHESERVDRVGGSLGVSGWELGLKGAGPGVMVVGTLGWRKMGTRREQHKRE